MIYRAELNFDKDFDEMLIKELSSFNFLIDKTLNSEEIRLKYFNFKKRSISQIPRQVFISNELNCPVELNKGFELLKGKFETGDNLIPHLSKKISDIDYDDPLLNDWGIHHLHLGDDFEEDGSGFIKRTGPVLFVRVYQDKAFFINILPHNCWTNQQMIKILHNNWPESIELYRVNGVTGLTHIPTDDDIKLFRKHGVISFIEIEAGIVYFPIGGGITSARTSLDVSRTVDYFHSLLRKLQKYASDNVQEIGKRILLKTGQKIEDLNLKLVIQGNVYYAVEQNTKVVFLLGEHSRGLN